MGSRLRNGGQTQTEGKRGARQNVHLGLWRLGFTRMARRDTRCCQRYTCSNHVLCFPPKIYDLWEADQHSRKPFFFNVTSWVFSTVSVLSNILLSFLLEATLRNTGLLQKIVPECWHYAIFLLSTKPIKRPNPKLSYFNRGTFRPCLCDWAHVDVNLSHKYRVSFSKKLHQGSRGECKYLYRYRWNKWEMVF